MAWLAAAPREPCSTTPVVNTSLSDCNVRPYLDVSCLHLPVGCGAVGRYLPQCYTIGPERNQGESV
jgi:hypothetical protein